MLVNICECFWNAEATSDAEVLDYEGYCLAVYEACTTVTLQFPPPPLFIPFPLTAEPTESAQSAPLDSPLSPLCR
jgi:hypothetical protein